MHVPLGRFQDSDHTIGWRVLPIMDRFCAKAYLTVADGIELSTEDPAHLDVLAEKAKKAAHALRIAGGMKECSVCGELVARVFPIRRVIGVNPDDASSGEIEDDVACQPCAGVSDEDVAVEDDTLNFRGAA